MPRACAVPGTVPGTVPCATPHHTTGPGKGIPSMHRYNFGGPPRALPAVAPWLSVHHLATARHTGHRGQTEHAVQGMQYGACRGWQKGMQGMQPIGTLSSCTDFLHPTTNQNRLHRIGQCKGTAKE